MADPVSREFIGDLHILLTDPSTNSGQCGWLIRNCRGILRVESPQVWKETETRWPPNPDDRSVLWFIDGENILITWQMIYNSGQKHREIGIFIAGDVPLGGGGLFPGERVHQMDGREDMHTIKNRRVCGWKHTLFIHQKRRFPSKWFLRPRQNPKLKLWCFKCSSNGTISCLLI